MIVGSVKENTMLEKRVSITLESAKNIIGLGLQVCIEKVLVWNQKQIQPSIKKHNTL